ncbi:MAG: GAF domain-containing sensor histidine kinase [Solirubrobacteraceae bacterium]
MIAGWMVRPTNLDEHLAAVLEGGEADLALLVEAARAGPGTRLIAAQGSGVARSWKADELVTISPRSALRRVPTCKRDLSITAVVRGEIVRLGSALIVPLSFSRWGGWLIVGVFGAGTPLAGSMEGDDELQRICEIEQLRREHDIYREVSRGAARLSRALASGSGWRSILQTAVATARDLLGTDAAYVSLPPSPSSEVFQMVAFENVHTTAFRRLDVAYGEGLGGLARARRQPVLVLDYGADRRLKKAPVEATLKEGFSVAASMPLIAETEVLGCLYVANRGDRTLSEDDVELLRLLGVHVANALECVAERESSQELVRVREREQLAYDLHDTVLRSLLEIALEAETATLVGEDVEGSLLTIAGSARDSLELLRAALNRHQAQASPTDVWSLCSIGEELRSMRQLGVVVRKVEVHRDDHELTRPIAECMLFVAKEALANAELHSCGNEITVALDCSDGEARLVVHDQGHGFVPAAEAGRRHYGLAGMHRRVADVEGRLWFEKPASGGFSLHVEIPVL